MPRRAFTLIELLVVVTIITVLLALLTPALDKAVYEAQLVTCASNEHTMAAAVTDYAMDFKRTYPYRQAMREQETWPMNICRAAPQYDDRPKLKPYMSINRTLNCALSPKIDIEGSLGTSYVFAEENMWFGMEYRYTNAAGAGVYLHGRRKLGARLEAPPAVPGKPLTTLNLLGGARYIVLPVNPSWSPPATPVKRTTPWPRRISSTARRRSRGSASTAAPTRSCAGTPTTLPAGRWT